MRILVLGGDGFCGWPTALKLKTAGHNVTIWDNLSRRNIDRKLGSGSLVKIPTLENRVEAARDLIKPGTIDFSYVDIAQPEDFGGIFKSEEYDVIVHFAEQRAAPYSMLGDKERRYTVDNNITGTHNILSGIVESGRDIHLVHLGTMGVYGYNDALGEIPEGYLDVKVGDHETSILYPTNPGSVYHMTKSLDQIMFQFYAKNWDLRITDLHQGIVWGIDSRETRKDPQLANRFDYDGIYGTVLNRFLVQAAIGHPLSVYGTGGQQRAFIHIEDTANCVKLAAEEDRYIARHTKRGKVKIYNQVSEVCSVKQLANMVAEKFDGTVEYLPNPRKELAENKLFVKNEGLKSLGFNPIMLQHGLLSDVRHLAETFKDNVNKDKILNSPEW